MKGNGQKAWPIVGVIGGFVVGVLSLFSVFGGLILAALMVVATPFILGFLVLEAIFGKKPVYVTSVKEAEKVLVATQEEVPVGAVSARVIRVQGACPSGYQFQVGDAWVLNGTVQGSAPLCPKAYQMLSEYKAEHAHRVEATELTIYCANGHMVEFEVAPEESHSLIAA